MKQVYAHGRKVKIDKLAYFCLYGIYGSDRLDSFIFKLNNGKVPEWYYAQERWEELEYYRTVEMDSFIADMEAVKEAEYIDRQMMMYAM